MWNNAWNDASASLTQSTSKDGQTQVTGNWNFGGNKITNLGAGAAANDAVRMAQTAKKGIGFQRDLTAASGNVAITGVGFTPKLMFLWGAMGATSSASFGWVDFQTMVTSSLLSLGGIWTADGRTILIETSSGNRQTAVPVSADADGFTIAWTKTGSPSGLAQFYALLWA
jgi:hypothetical protein